jgi:hypothetical protein
MPFRPELPQRHLDLSPLSHLAPNRKVTDRAQRAPQKPREKSLSAAILGHPDALVPDAAATCEGGGRDHKGEH